MKKKQLFVFVFSHIVVLINAILLLTYVSERVYHMFYGKEFAGDVSYIANWYATVVYTGWGILAEMVILAVTFVIWKVTVQIIRDRYVMA